MKRILTLILSFMFFISVVSAQTNVINITNSTVVINNYYVNNAKPYITNVTNSPRRYVVISPQIMERIRWENFLLARQKAYEDAYLQRIRNRSRLRR